jgi:hypothetical protein
MARKFVCCKKTVCILAYEGSRIRLKENVVNLNVYISITKCFYIGNLCFALEQDFGTSFRDFRYVNCFWIQQVAVLIIYLEVFLCEILALPAYLRTLPVLVISVINKNYNCESLPCVSGWT